MGMIDDLDRRREASRRRLMMMLGGFGLLALIVLARLTWLQVLRADSYREQLDDWSVLDPDYPSALRGDILERHGHVLARDAPSWQVQAYYGVLDHRPTPTGRNRYVWNLARRLRRTGKMDRTVPLEATEEAVHQRIAESWQKLADLAQAPTWQLYRTADAIVDRIRTLREQVARRRGFDDDVEEERRFHAILKDLSAAEANRMRLALAPYPWFRVHTSTSRVYEDDPAVCHLIGRLRDVGREDIEAAREADELDRPVPGDRIGASGAEYLGEDRLRGRRGKVRRNRAGEYLENIAPRRGQDVRLTIDLDMQRWIYERLRAAVRDCPTASGASAVVLDVNSREVLAAVSYPGYTRGEYAEHYGKLARDAVRQPLRFRAVANSYATGSILKPLTAMAALGSGLTSVQETIPCTGYLYPQVQNAFRCWTVARGMPGHGPLNVEQALMHSCNIFFYTLGRRLGVQRECQWFDQFGLGRAAGTGLLEEATGVVPTPEYLQRRYQRPLSQTELATVAQNLGIGQGEVMVTPMQAANLAATIATGIWEPVTLLREPAGQDRPARRLLPGSREDWRVVRQGMFDVVNDPTGTAFHVFQSARQAKIAGKTGTAQTNPRRAGCTYELNMYDGTIRHLEAADATEARDRITQMGESVVSSRLVETKWWPGPPEPGHLPNHTWFMGFAPRDNPQVALAVLVEYGVGGAQTAGPVARDIFKHIFGIESAHPDEVPADGPDD